MRVDTNGITLDVTIEGDGPDVLLLHGGRTTAPSAGADPCTGGRGLPGDAPDLRGCGASDRPAEVAAYQDPGAAGRRHRPARRVVGATHPSRSATTGARACRGHWAALLPDRIDHLACLSVGHPTAFHRVDYDQLAMSWWLMLLFQFEGVAEMVVGQRLCELPRLDPPSGRGQRRRAARRPGHLTGGGLNWYCANLGPTCLITAPPELPPSSRRPWAYGAATTSRCWNRR